MTVQGLIEVLNSYPGEAHVVVSVVPNKQLIIGIEGEKIEVHDVWCDGFGVVNVIATEAANRIDDSLRRENDLE